jgi:hypothetical protein
MLAKVYLQDNWVDLTNKAVEVAPWRLIAGQVDRYRLLKSVDMLADVNEHPLIKCMHY